MQDLYTALGFKPPKFLVNSCGIKVYIGTKDKDDWSVEIPKEIVKKKCRRCDKNFVLYGVTESKALSITKDFTKLAREMKI